MPYTSRLQLSFPPLSIPSLVLGPPGTNTQDPNKKAFVDAARPTAQFLTYKLYQECSQRFAAGLIKAGLKSGDRVMLMSGNCISIPIVLMGTIMAQGIYNSANPAFTARELAFQIKDCKPRFILAAPNCINTALQVASISGIASSAVSLLDHLLSVQNLQDSSVGATAHWSNLMASRQEGDQFVWEELDSAKKSNRTAIIIYSSGTTGLPKGVAISHYQVTSNLLQLRALLFSDNSITTRRTLGVLPCYHGLGLMYYGLLCPSIGAEVYIMDRYNLLQMLGHIQQFCITELLLVPPIVVAMAKHVAARNGQFDLSSIKKVTAAAAPLGLEPTQLFEEIWGGRVKLRQAFGMTEAPALSLAWDEADRSDGASVSVGELMPGIEAKLMRDDETEELAFDTPGELWLRGPNILKEYWNNHKATVETKSSDGWLKTGDIATVDANKKWYIVDRKKELIKVRGAQVAPAELEALLLEHPQVLEAAVIGIKTTNGDENPRAYVVPRRRSMVSELELQKFVEARAVKQKRLTGGVIFQDQLPKTSVGKIKRRMLREKALEETQKLQQGPSKL
ncbi:Fc.00g025220.m01.CDS01 [Cosmosporella sp. VM-42]